MALRYTMGPPGSSSTPSTTDYSDFADWYSNFQAPWLDKDNVSANDMAWFVLNSPSSTAGPNVRRLAEQFRNPVLGSGMQNIVPDRGTNQSPGTGVSAQAPPPIPHTTATPPTNQSPGTGVSAQAPPPIPHTTNLQPFIPNEPQYTPSPSNPQTIIPNEPPQNPIPQIPTGLTPFIPNEPRYTPPQSPNPPRRPNPQPIIPQDPLFGGGRNVNIQEVIGRLGPILQMIRGMRGGF